MRPWSGHRGKDRARAENSSPRIVRIDNRAVRSGRSSMQARISDKQEIARETLLVTLDLLGEQVEFQPGQYFFARSPIRGIRTTAGCAGTSPSCGTARAGRAGVRHAAAGLGVQALPARAAGRHGRRGRAAERELRASRGTSRPLVFVAGGIGITVFRSMLRHIREERLPYRVTLVYSNRDAGRPRSSTSSASSSVTCRISASC